MIGHICRGEFHHTKIDFAIEGQKQPGCRVAKKFIHISLEINSGIDSSLN